MRVAVLLLGALALCACAASTVSTVNQPTVDVSTAPRRPLTAAEKAALAPLLAQNMKDPNAAQFKWMPVIIAKRDNITDYCGLVNGKNTYGGYTGFLRFYAFLTADAKGQYTRGEARAFEEPNREINPIDPRWLNGVCEQYGYVDFSQAQP